MAVVDRNSPVPLWSQVLDDLRDRLDRGEFDAGFPSDAELTARYGVSRHTAREAVRHLQDEGVISRERGRGTFLTSDTIEQATGALYSLFRSVEARGLDQRSEVIDLSTVTDDEPAARLGLGPAEPLIRLERLRLAGGQILAHDTAWLPAILAAPLLEVDFSHTALYDELQSRCGVRPVAGTEWITTRLPEPRERRLLELAPDQPVFHIRRSSGVGDRPIEWRETTIRGDRYSFVAEWSPSAAYETVLTETFLTENVPREDAS